MNINVIENMKENKSFENNSLDGILSDIKNQKERVSFLLHRELSLNKYRSPSQIKVELLSGFEILEEFGFNVLSMLMNSNPSFLPLLSICDLYDDDKLQKTYYLRFKYDNNQQEFLPINSPVKLLLTKLGGF